MNFPIYSIQREVIKEFESLVSSLAFVLCFHKTLFVFPSFEISFSQMIIWSFQLIELLMLYELCILLPLVCILFYKGRVKYIDLIVG